MAGDIRAGCLHRWAAGALQPPGAPALPPAAALTPSATPQRPWMPRLSRRTPRRCAQSRPACCRRVRPGTGTLSGVLHRCRPAHTRCHPVHNMACLPRPLRVGCPLVLVTHPTPLPGPPPRQHVDVDVRHSLARLGPVLDGQGQRGGAVVGLERGAHTLRQEPEVRYLQRGEGRSGDTQVSRQQGPPCD